MKNSTSNTSSGVEASAWANVPRKPTRRLAPRNPVGTHKMMLTIASSTVSSVNCCRAWAGRSPIGWHKPRRVKGRLPLRWSYLQYGRRSWMETRCFARLRRNAWIESPTSPYGP